MDTSESPPSVPESTTAPQTTNAPSGAKVKVKKEEAAKKSQDMDTEAMPIKKESSIDEKMADDR